MEVELDPEVELEPTETALVMVLDNIHIPTIPIDPWTPLITTMR